MKISKGLRQCYELQDALFEAHKTAKAPRELAMVATAWEKLEERKRILRGKPLPGSYKPKPKPPKHISASHTGPVSLSVLSPADLADPADPAPSP